MNTVTLLTAFYSVSCVALAIAMVVTLNRSPLFPFQMNDLDWLRDQLSFAVRCCVLRLRKVSIAN